MTECFRSDKAHFDFHTGLLKMSAQEAKRAAIQKYPCKVEYPDWSIVISHAMRIETNRLMQNHIVKEFRAANPSNHVVTIRPETGHELLNRPQIYELCGGTRLVFWVDCKHSEWNLDGRDEYRRDCRTQRF